MHWLIVISYFFTLIFINMPKDAPAFLSHDPSLWRWLRVHASLEADIWAPAVLSPLGVGMHKSWLHRDDCLCNLRPRLGFSSPVCICMTLPWIRLPISAAADQPGWWDLLIMPFQKLHISFQEHGFGFLWCSSALSIKKGRHKNSVTLTHLQKQHIHTCGHKHWEQLNSYRCKS